MNLFPTVFLLGLAGIGPTGTLIILTALSMGISKKQIMKVTLTTFFGTVLVGVIFSKVLSSGVDAIADLLNRIPHFVYTCLELISGIALLIWGLGRIFCKKKIVHAKEKKESFFVRFLNKGMFLLGVIFAFAALADPSFMALLAISTQNDNIFLIALANATWILICQFPIFVLTVAVMFDKHESVINYFQNLLNKNGRKVKVKKVLSFLLTVLLISAGILMLLNPFYVFF